MKLPRYFFVMLFLLALVFLPRCSNAVIQMKQERDLARELGIAVDDYPATSTFPKNYFLVVLKPSVTTIAEVHNIVRGYERVLSCYGISELYYYYSEDDNKALRFEIVYDDQGHFERLIGEDSDSRTLNSQGCVAGLLRE